MEDFNSIDGSIFLRFGYKLEGIFFFFFWVWPYRMYCLFFFVIFTIWLYETSHKID